MGEGDKGGSIYDESGLSYAGKEGDRRGIWFHRQAQVYLEDGNRQQGDIEAFYCDSVSTPLVNWPGEYDSNDQKGERHTHGVLTYYYNGKLCDEITSKKDPTIVRANATAGSIADPSTVIMYAESYKYYKRAQLMPYRNSEKGNYHYNTREYFGKVHNGGTTGNSVMCDGSVASFSNNQYYRDYWRYGIEN